MNDFLATQNEILRKEGCSVPCSPSFCPADPADELFEAIQAHLDTHFKGVKEDYAAYEQNTPKENSDEELFGFDPDLFSSGPRTLSFVVNDLDAQLSKMERGESFADLLNRKINDRIAEKMFKNNSEIYTKASITRQLFSDIFSKKNYMPSKPTVLALALALKLSLEETEELLRKADHALDDERCFDYIVKNCIENGYYDIDRINIFLYEHGLPQLGSTVREGKKGSNAASVPNNP